MNHQDLEELFVCAIEKDNIDSVKKYTDIYNFNAVLRSKNKIWDTNYLSILAIACYSGSSKTVKYLLSNNVDINQVDSLKRRSALHWAVASGNYEIVSMLIEAGALVNVLDRNSITPLILCANSGDLKILRYLIKHGASMNIFDRMNSSALDYACMRLHIEIAKELIINGCKCSSSTSFCVNSPLKHLIFNKEYQTARLLIETGFNLNSEKWIANINVNLIKDKNDIDEAFFAWIRDYMCKPRQLKSICRKTVRNILSNESLQEKINSLEIPKMLKGYLMMKN